MKLLSILLLPIQLSLATTIFLSPLPEHQLNKVSLTHAGARLAKHLGLDAFEPYHGLFANGEEAFVGKGSKSALLLSVHKDDVARILPSALKPAFSVSNTADSFDTLITSYISRAQHTYSKIVTTALAHSSNLFYVPENLKDQLSILSQFLDSEDPSTFAAVQLDLTHADESTINVIRAFIESAVARSGEIQLAVLTYAATPEPTEKRQEQTPLPSVAPAPGYSACFDSVDACSNSTNSCSGHGKCMESTKPGCFVCSCSASEAETWVGSKCERKDVSGPFVLISGTVIVLLLVAFGSVSLLSSVGEQELPSTLMGGAVQSRKD